MSIKIYKLLQSKYIFLILSMLIGLCKNSWAAIGYEENTNVMISTTKEISEIEIGSDIIYYDFEDEKYYNAFVNFKDYTIAGIRLEVTQIENDHDRVFLIED